MTMMQYPASASERRVSISSLPPSLSRLASGSSRNTIFCPIASVDAVMSRCFCPPERERHFRAGSSFISLQTTCTCLCIFSGGNARFSHPKAISSSTILCTICSSAFCRTTPTFRQMYPGFLPATFSPPTSTSPESSPPLTPGIMPLTIYMRVLFPSPEWPERRVIFPYSAGKADVLEDLRFSVVGEIYLS